MRETITEYQFRLTQIFDFILDVVGDLHIAACKARTYLLLYHVVEDIFHISNSTSILQPSLVEKLVFAKSLQNIVFLLRRKSD